MKQCERERADVHAWGDLLRLSGEAAGSGGGGRAAGSASLQCPAALLRH